MGIPSRTKGQLSVSREYSPAARVLELPAQEFIHRQGVSGVLLLLAALLALALANSPWADMYFRLWDAKISFDFGFVHLDKSLHHWINDGLMTLFFFLVGMEIKGELSHGYLSSPRKAALPAVAALGGMVVPAIVFVAINAGSPTTRGWGIPMATDIAFAVGVLALVPGIAHELKVFLLALAIVDDIGAILVIAIFYTNTFSFAPLLIGAAALVVILLLKVAKVRFGFPYVICGILFWLAISKSGVHATIAGVILAFLVSNRAVVTRKIFDQRAGEALAEFREATNLGEEGRADAALGVIEALARSTDPPIEKITRGLHPWVGFVILPLFAFANSGVVMSISGLRNAMGEPVLWGVIFGLVIGKPIGIVVFTWIAAKAGLAEMPSEVSLAQLTGLGAVAGIGFTVAIFIASLAFEEQATVNAAKIGILAASALAGIAGFLILNLSVARDANRKVG